LAVSKISRYKGPRFASKAKLTKGELTIGTWVEIETTLTLAATGAHHLTAKCAGYYDGLRPSPWDGVPYHYFVGGYIGETPQGATGRHGFPAANLAE
jgi:hypothetical protein